MNEMATREDRIFWQALKICPMCEKNHLYNGEKICLECKAYHNEYTRKFYMAHRDAMNTKNKERNRELYKRRKEQGLCTKCGSKFLKPGRSKCYQCLAKDQDIARRYRDRLNGGVVIDG